MSGESVFGWLKVFAVLLASTIIGIVGWKIMVFLRDFVGKPNVLSNSVDKTIGTVTGGAASGGEDSLGGVFARFREWVSGDDAAIEAMKRGSKPATENDNGHFFSP